MTSSIMEALRKLRIDRLVRGQSPWFVSYERHTEDGYCSFFLHLYLFQVSTFWGSRP